MALGLTLGIILAVSGGPVTTINQSATGACGASASPAPSASPAAAPSDAASDPAGAGASAAASDAASDGASAAASDAAGDGASAAANDAGSTAASDAAGDGASAAASDAAGDGASAAAGDGASAAASDAASTAASAGASAAASPCPSASASANPAAAAVVPPAATFANGPTAFFQLGNLAINPVDGTGAAINLHQTAAEAATSMNCTLRVPNNPLSARGLATPWQLGDGCTMANAANVGAFVEATILAPNGSVQIYNPLVITAGTTPAAAPVAPTIPAGSAVIIDVGFNGNNLVLEGRGARQGRCVDALGQSVIGQVSACNAVNFYRAANAAIANGTLAVPAAGTAADGQPCETVRNFALIDQDQSDNVITTYLINANGQTAQDTAANVNALAGATPIGNGSDDRLLADFVDPANGCTAFSAADSTFAAGTSGSQALNELSARVNQTGTIAVVPVNDEMTLVNGAYSIAKTNVYRSLVDQPLLAANTDPNTVAADYCQNVINVAPARNQLDLTRDTAFGSPVPATGTNLASFLGARLAASFGVLGCTKFGLTDPISATVNGAGAATAVAYNLAQQKATIAAAAGGTATPAASPAGPGGSGLPWFAAPPRRHRHHQNGTGM